jgi:hypothetical protein
LNTPLDAMLVIDSSKSDTASSVVKSYAYDFAGNSNSAYQGIAAVDDGLGFPYAAKNPLTIKNFKAMEQLFVNSTTLADQKSYNLNVDYYLLVKPAVKQVQTDAILWDSSSVGNIPAEYIKGYNVYKETYGKLLKLNHDMKGPIPYVAGSTELSLTCMLLSDCYDTVKPTDKIVVVIEDKYGNKWPDITVSVPVPTINLLSPTSGAIATPVTITGTGFGATQGTSKVNFGAATATVLSWSDKQITTTVPVGAATGQLFVYVEVGNVKSNMEIFTVNANTVPVYISFKPSAELDKTKCFISQYDPNRDPDGCDFVGKGLVVAGVPMNWYYYFNAVRGQSTSVSVTAGYLEWNADRFTVNGNISIPASATVAAYRLEVNLGAGTFTLTSCQNSGCY